MSAKHTAVQSDRLSFRELDSADEAFVAALVGDDETMRFYPSWIREQGAQFWLTRQRERYERDGHGLWLVSLSASEEPVALIGLNMQIVDDRVEPEIGYLVHRPYWRRGIAGEGAAAVRRYAFDDCGYPRVISLIRPINTPSAGVARKLGMTLWKRTVFSGLDHDVYRADADSARGAGTAAAPSTPVPAATR